MTTPEPDRDALIARRDQIEQQLAEVRRQLAALDARGAQ